MKPIKTATSNTGIVISRIVVLELLDVLEPASGDIEGKLLSVLHGPFPAELVLLTTTDPIKLAKYAEVDVPLYNKLLPLE